MSLATMHDLLVAELRDLYSAEKQLVQALPKMARAATNESLKQAFVNHLAATRVHVERLEDACFKLGVKPGGKKCKGMEGLVAAGAQLIDEDGDDAVRDAGLISAAQRIEHYEIAAYGGAIEFAKELGEIGVAKLLQATIGEEEAADKTLNEIAVTAVNEAAVAAIVE